MTVRRRQGITTTRNRTITVYTIRCWAVLRHRDATVGCRTSSETKSLRCRAQLSTAIESGHGCRASSYLPYWARHFNYWPMGLVMSMKEVVEDLLADYNALGRKGSMQRLVLMLMVLVHQR